MATCAGLDSENSYCIASEQSARKPWSFVFLELAKILKKTVTELRVFQPSFSRLLLCVNHQKHFNTFLSTQIPHLMDGLAAQKSQQHTPSGKKWLELANWPLTDHTLGHQWLVLMFLLLHLESAMQFSISRNIIPSKRDFSLFFKRPKIQLKILKK